MELRNKVIILFSVLGIIVGYLSFLITNLTNFPEINILLLVILGLLVKKVLERKWKIKEGRQWWIRNGGTLYVLLWLVVWTILYNLS